MQLGRKLEMLHAGGVYAAFVILEGRESLLPPPSPPPPKKNVRRSTIRQLPRTLNKNLHQPRLRQKKKKKHMHTKSIEGKRMM